MAVATDDDIRLAVSTELGRDQHIHDANVQVQATNGAVTLTGTVDNLLSRERAARLAAMVRGVRSVDDRIEVIPALRPDSEIAADVRKALEYNPATAIMPITVRVRNAVVTLTGTITSWQEQQLAERVANGVRGVRFTQNDLTTQPNTRRTATEIADDVKSRLGWDALVEHDPITVSVQDRQVVLSGTTGSLAERVRAANDARVDGVVGVDASRLLVDTAQRPDANLRRVAVSKSDAEIAKAIMNAARYDPRIRAANITPRVADGAVTLLGTVDTLSARMAAAALARNTVGVRTVNNELTVRPLRRVSNAILQHQVSDALVFDPLVDMSHVKLTVDNGQVTLTGSVNTNFERAEMLDDVSGIPNVIRVDDQLAVQSPAEPFVYSAWVDPFTPHADGWYVTSLRPSLSDSEIARRIQENLKRSAFVDPKDVNVSVERGEATLTGTTSSYRERQAAIDGALEAGAVAVHDQLSVS
ncbi:MAG TPA: BON domain-containing protein [Polyangiaceae bacterium]|jgi:osmotically-inducible protein OsmY|nr:BON domain-containing protein [Polyangiaceae bacterium]